LSTVACLARLTLHGFVIAEVATLSTELFPCVCCGYLTLDEPPGSYGICPICFWEDDEVQLRYPHLAGGANHVSLFEGQSNYADYGACEERIKPFVRAALATDAREEGWRPIDPAIDRFDGFPIRAGDSAGNAYFEASTASPAHESDGRAEGFELYWWRDSG
jgi:hypothetical protein